MKNPTLRPLIGGVHAVTLSASEAKSRNPDGAIHKTQLERAGAPTFEVIVELVSKNRCRIYRNVSKVVDDLLLGQALVVEERWKVPHHRLISFHCLIFIRRMIKPLLDFVRQSRIPEKARSSLPLRTGSRSFSES